MTNDTKSLSSQFLASCDNMEEGDQFQFSTFCEAVEVCDDCCTIAGWHEGSARYIVVRRGA